MSLKRYFLSLFAAASVLITSMPGASASFQVLVMATAPSGDITTGLVGWWKYDAGSGSTAVDSGSGGNDGTLTNSPSWVTGMIGPYALTFDGSTNYVQIVSTPSSFDFLNTTFSVACWFKTTTSAAGVIISKGGNGGATATSNGWAVRVNDNSEPGTVRAFLKDNAGGGGLAIGRNSTNTGTCDGNWHHVVAVFTTDTSTQAGNTADVYVDGVLSNGTSANNGAPYAGSPADIAVGVRSVTATPNNFFAGSVDDVRIYNRRLTAADVTALYAYR